MNHELSSIRLSRTSRRDYIGVEELDDDALPASVHARYRRPGGHDGPVLGLRYLRTADDQVTLLVSRQCG